ncbi:galactose mutarotase-like isoform X1 [Bacillus rossius redtenbacheri]|uniref:galactose mutarotase-like isoform X1 n=1 Tax=Bacillus rossius redtenbacheri TaxID=93214 RepID=UPI002FDEFD28
MTNHGPRTTLALLLVGACLARGTETAPRSKGISRDAFGSAGSQAVDRYTLRNGRGAEVQVMSYGATVTSVKLPDRSGGVDDVVLGFDDLDGYLKADNPYFGAVVGRVANRIKNGRFKIGNETYQISLNDGNNTLHGGLKGFDKKVWSSCVEDDKVVFSYLSSDGEEGFPGAVLASVTYQLTDSNELKVTWKATSTKPTPINLTNHSYFNLCGHANGSQCIYEHLVKINADYYTVTDHENIPTGEIASVTSTPFDLRNYTLLKTGILSVSKFDDKDGYDHNLCIKPDGGDDLRFVAKVVHPGSGRALELRSNQPGVQFYTGNSIGEITGKGGSVYRKHGAFCLEPQDYPDAVNHANFPNSIVLPGNEYIHRTVYRFSVEQ